MEWNSELYLRYEKERTQPALDLVGKIPLDSPAEIIDLGCGPGNSTKALRLRWANARITGLDSSPKMIEEARKSSLEVEWRTADIRTWSEPGRFDLIFANASLQWIEDQHTLTKRLIEPLKPGAVLAFQMPALYNQPASAVVKELAGSPAWKPYRLQERSTLSVQTPGQYYDWLAPLSRDLQIWESVYFHQMADHRQILEFYSSTGLKPYLEGLPSEEIRDRFKAEVLKLYQTLFPAQMNGKVLFPFRRLFVIATR
jgi:trans-aconitate 2-methyltransferase